MSEPHQKKHYHMRKNSRIFVILCCLFLTAMYSCTKSNDNSNNNDNETQTASDNAFAQSTSSDAIAMSSQSEDNGITGTITDSTAGFMFNNNVTINLNFTTSPKVLTIDFGSTNTLCFDGKYRRGKVMISFTGLYRDSGSNHTITFDNYYVNDYKVDGNIAVVNNGHNEAGNLNFSVKSALTITDTSNHTLTYNDEHVREWVSGEETTGVSGWHDDVYSITGSSSGTSFNGTQFTSNITSALVVALNCKWIEQGTIEFKPAGKLTRTIDFGNGDCDNKATVTISGVSFDISL
jgi:hypothetical protein